MEGSKVLALTDHERAVKRKLVEATKSIRKKISTFRSGVSVGEQAFQRTFKPIIKPLTEVASIVKAQKPEPEPLKQITQKAEPLLKQITHKGEPVAKRKIEAQREPLDKQKLEEYVSKTVKKEEEDDDERFFDTEEEGIHPKASEYLKDLRETPQYFDIQYGPHLDDKGLLKMGNTDIRFGMKTMKLMRGGDIIAQYDITPELLNVLFTNTSPINVSERTKKTYAQILNVTNAIRKRYDGNSGIQGTRSQKYSAFIKPILEDYNLLIKTTPTPSRSVRKGEGINKYLTPQVDYRYWDSLKELVDRLRLLWASQHAGNNSHHNEIVAILEELREAGVIY